MATAKTFTYDDKPRSAITTATSISHRPRTISPPPRSICFSSQPGNELERAEASDGGNGLVLREQGRGRTGDRR